MKVLIKVIVSALFFVGAIQLLNAQTIGLGVRSGVNISTAELEVKIDDSWNTDTKDYSVGFTAGLIAEIGISDMFAFQPEVNFIQKGYKTTVQNGAKQEFTTTLNYMEVPLLVKGKFGTGDLKFNALLGPTFGYAFNGKVKSDAGDTDIDFGKDNIKQTEIGATLGLGAGYDIYPGTIFLDARVGWGLTDLDDSGDGNFHWHNRGYSIGVGYIYNFGL